MVDLHGFLVQNKNKVLTIRIWFYTTYFRFCIRFVPMKYLHSHFGEEGQESSAEESEESYKFARIVGKQVNLSASHTLGEAKCLAKALTVQKLMYKRGIHSTLYLGVKKEDSHLTAHAWIRVGIIFVTGGYGKGYAVVAKYRK